MKKTILALLLAILATTAYAASSDQWSASMGKYYRSAAGDNEASVRLRLVKASGTSLASGKICGKPAKGSAVCVDVSAGRMKQGDSTTLWVKFPNTKYPIERVYFRN